MIKKVISTLGYVSLILGVIASILSITAYDWNSGIINIAIEGVRFYLPEFLFISVALLIVSHGKPLLTLMRNQLKSNSVVSVILSFGVVALLLINLYFAFDMEYQKARAAKYLVGPAGILLLENKRLHRAAAEHAKFLRERSYWERFSLPLLKKEKQLSNLAHITKEYQFYYALNWERYSRSELMEASAIGAYFDPKSSIYKNNLLYANTKYNLALTWLEKLSPNKVLNPTGISLREMPAG